MKKVLFLVFTLSLLILSACSISVIPESNMILVDGNEQLPSFLIDKYEVTQKEYKKIMKANPSAHKGCNFPVESISFYDVLYFCNQLSVQQGLEPCYVINGTTDVSKWNYVPHTNAGIEDYKNIICNFDANGFRVPTWDEWEYAARGGKNYSPYLFAGSDTVDEVSWYKSNTDCTHKPGQKKPNALGIYDMSGNVWEWCWDSFTGSSDARYYKGGSYRDITFYSRIDNRARTFSAKGVYDALGIRLVRTNKPLQN